MRMILAYLAIANIRWARADIARSERLADEADAALLRSRGRVRVADALATRAGLGPRFSHLR
ncbi:hypothetical protein FV232_07290 [Methylobacterium sp. WL30]|nr:hypothetical protein FV223_00655 [Methylobacterium sp. WL116]TXN41812.1 hypothetical protein FV225_01010 [Methylobacterium sp. WL93]TXN51875.1 hypothetical protein FV227_05940 [Methylobacterium sp. WL119]TXN68862.1 hypothetical protein FV232_07290 [Methylobacterium sp. WL30]